MRPSGCYFMAIVEALTDLFDIPFTHDSVAAFFAAEIKNLHDDVDNEMFVRSPQLLMDDLVGKGRVEFRGWQPTTYACAEDEIEFGCWHKPGNTYNHFTHNNGRGIVLYDPWSAQGSDSVREGFLVSRRVARLIA